MTRQYINDIPFICGIARAFDSKSKPTSPLPPDSPKKRRDQTFAAHPPLPRLIAKKLDKKVEGTVWDRENGITGVGRRECR